LIRHEHILVDQAPPIMSFYHVLYMFSSLKAVMPSFLLVERGAELGHRGNLDAGSQDTIAGTQRIVVPLATLTGFT
jgi:hypothetical protein